MKKIFYLIMFLCVTNISNSQENSSIKDIFTMQLFLNKMDFINNHKGIKFIKNDSTYNKFKDFIELKINKLTLNTVDNNISDFEFCMVNSDSITFKSNINELDVSCGFQKKFVLAIQKDTYKIYRIMGFDTNDFLFFLEDFKKTYRDKFFKKISSKYFLKNYFVNELDFNCIYNGLKSKNMDFNKFPCLRNCNSPFFLN